MNRLDTLFENNDNVLSVYFTAGFPKLEDTSVVLEALENNGVNMIEIGMPFSDPLADGPTIQKSSEVALANGMNIKTLFEQLSSCNIKDSKSAMVLMGYLNPVLQYGMENFCKEAAVLGIDGVILPDLPMQEYLDEHRATFEKYGLKNIFLITPQTSEERIRLIDKCSNAFIYMVSSASTTGAKSGIEDHQKAYFERIKSMQLKNPTVIGFGISDNKSFVEACDHSSGAIIGSAFINAIENSKNLKGDIAAFTKRIKG